MKNNKNKMKLTLNNLNTLKVWWEIAYNKGDSDIYNMCNDVYEENIGKHLEMYRYKKLGRLFSDLKIVDLAYIPEKCLNKETGIIDKYYSKIDIIRICNDNKIVAQHVYKHIKGELIEDYLRDLKEEYYQYFMEEETACIYKSKLSLNMFRVLSKEEQEKILEVLDKTTGLRKGKVGDVKRRVGVEL